jgi:hypothetical protein
MIKGQTDFQLFKQDILNATNEISQKESLETGRKGISGFRDKLTYYKVAIFFAYGYISIVSTIILFLGVTPQAIENVNNGLTSIGAPFQLPVGMASFVAISLVFFLFVGGVIAMRFLGLYKREGEIGVLQNAGFYLLSKQNMKIIEQNEIMIKQNEEIIKMQKEEKEK